MKFAFSSNAYTNYSLKESIADISKIGYQGVEIMCDSPHAYPLLMNSKKISEIKNELSNNNIQISNLNAFTLFAIGDTYHPSWIEEDLNYRRLRIDHTINCLKLAKDLGAKNISIEPGLLIENSDEFLRFIKNFDSEYIGLNFDIGHFVCVNEDPSILINKLENYIHHFHLADIKDKIHNHLILGMGSIDIKKVLDSISKIDFMGFITVELYPYKDNPSKAALESFEYLKNISI